MANVYIIRNFIQMSCKKVKKLCIPNKLWIDGRVYDIDKSKVNLFDIETIDGKFVTRFHLPKFYHNWLLKNYVIELETIRKQTSTEILVPPPQSNENICISGPLRDKVVEAREEFHSIVNEIRNSIQPKQFIAIPTLSDEIATNFNAFKAKLLNRDAKIDGLDESVFQKAEKLHLTICVLALLDSIEENEGKRLLSEIRNEILMPMLKDKGEIMLRLQGVESMQSNSKKCNVLYTNAQIQGEDEHFNLQSIANKISRFFYEHGLTKELQDCVKIHVTLINTKYRISNQRRKKRWTNRVPFDASTISEEFADYVFGVCSFSSLHLSLIGGPPAKNHDFPGFYKPLAIETL